MGVVERMKLDLSASDVVNPPTAAELADRINLENLSLAQLLQARKYLQLRIDEFDKEIERRPPE
jgi:hypothetical protein